MSKVRTRVPSFRANNIVSLKNTGMQSIFDKIIEEKKAIAKGIQNGQRKVIIERERDVRFVTPVLVIY